MQKMKFKNDKYKKARGGRSRLLEIHCEECNQFLLFYQKDGTGILKRLYIDRIVDNSDLEKQDKLLCPNCKKLLGVKYVYEKENRLAFRLFAGEITKKIAKSY
jgi:hypothetical protein